MDNLARSFEAYKQNKSDYDRNRLSFKKTIVDISYNPGGGSEFRRKENSTMTPTQLSKAYFSAVHTNNRFFKDNKRVSVAFSSQVPTPKEW
jgi:hypothetical protein